MKKAGAAILCVFLLLVLVWVTGRYGRKLTWILERGDSDLSLCAYGSASRVDVKTGEQGHTIGLGEDSTDESGAAENGIHVLLERDDVYSLGWYFESKSGGMINADGTPLEAGRDIYLDTDIFLTAANLERPVPVMLSFSDKDGKTLAQVNLSFDTQSPVLTVTLTADAGILVNGIEEEKLAVPTAYEQILSQYRIALEEAWSGQQLVDAGLNYMIRDVAPETMEYTTDDLDDDGVPELAIGTVTGDAFYGKLIFALYTLDESGEPLPIFSSMERDRYYYAGGNRFANIGSSGADSSFVTTLKLEDGDLVDMTFTTEPKDYVQMPFVPIAEAHDG